MLSYFFEVCVPHVFDAEDKDVCVGVCCAADGGVERGGLFFGRFLLDGGRVDDAGSLGFGHFDDGVL